MQTEAILTNKERLDLMMAEKGVCTAPADREEGRLVCIIPLDALEHSNIDIEDFKAIMDSCSMYAEVDPITSDILVSGR